MSHADSSQSMPAPPVQHEPDPRVASADRGCVRDSRPLESVYAPTPANVKPLRLGILLNSSIQPRWLAWLLDAITGSGTAEIVCVVQCDIGSFALQRPPGRSPPAASAAKLAYTLYSRVDCGFTKRRLTQPDPTELIDVSPWFAGAKLVSGNSIEGSNDCALTDSDLADIRREGLDVALAVDSDRWSGEILSGTRFGVWFCSWSRRGDAELFWTVSEARPMTSCSLSILTESGVSPVIDRIDVPAHPRSLHLTRRKAYSAAASMTLRCLRRLQRHGTGAIAGQLPDPVPDPSEPDAFHGGPPTTRQLLLFLSRLTLRWLRFRWQYRHGEWWFLALRQRPLAFVVDGPEGDRLKGFAPLSAAPGHSYADPFLLEEEGAVHLFFEDLDTASRKGVISHSRLAADGTLSSPRTVLERPYHLSYPFVFRWEGRIYMLPETGHNRTVELYRCQEFPHRWTLDRELLKGWRATDATLHRSDDGGWWMFVAVDELGEGNTLLFLFQAPIPLGPWRPHPQNPIQTDPRHTRPAGRLFRREGRLLRPAQDGSLRYGGGMWLMEVLELTERSYRERPFVRIGPDWLEGNLCLHHLDATDRFEVIDGMRLRPGTL